LKGGAKKPAKSAKVQEPPQKTSNGPDRNVDVGRPKELKAPYQSGRKKKGKTITAYAGVIGVIARGVQSHSIF